tara:strand:- start:272 stop:718 length:447 start_codon:yes stop_codon:yes gene_type:complete
VLSPNLPAAFFSRGLGRKKISNVLFIFCAVFLSGMGVSDQVLVRPKQNEIYFIIGVVSSVLDAETNYSKKLVGLISKMKPDNQRRVMSLMEGSPAELHARLSKMKADSRGRLYRIMKRLLNQLTRKEQLSLFSGAISQLKSGIGSLGS